MRKIEKAMLEAVKNKQNVKLANTDVHVENGSVYVFLYGHMIMQQNARGERKYDAKITVTGRDANIEGIEAFRPANVRAVDLRAGAAMVIAALSANGTTVIDDIYHIERGYEDMVGKLRSVGADIKKISDKLS